MNENEDKTPTGWHYAITPEDVEKIKRNDRETINRVYFDNLPKFKNIARSYLYHLRAVGHGVDFSYFNDIIQQIYIDLPYYSYRDTTAFYWGIKATCVFVVYGRSSVRRGWFSLDEPITEDGEDTFECLLGYTPFDEIDEENETREKEVIALNAINAQKQLNQRQKDILTAIALRVRPYVGIFAYEYGKAQKEVA